MAHPFLTASGAFSLPAIMRCAWARARQSYATQFDIPAVLRPYAAPAATLRALFADELRYVWSEAKSARCYAVWAAEHDAAAEAAKLLDAPTQEIRNLHFEREAAVGIDNTREYFATRHAIDARLARLEAA